MSLLIYLVLGPFRGKTQPLLSVPRRCPYTVIFTYSYCYTVLQFFAKTSQYTCLICSFFVRALSTPSLLTHSGASTSEIAAGLECWEFGASYVWLSRRARAIRWQASTALEQSRCAREAIRTRRVELPLVPITPRDSCPPIYSWKYLSRHVVRGLKRKAVRLYRLYAYFSSVYRKYSSVLSRIFSFLYHS